MKSLKTLIFLLFVAVFGFQINSCVPYTYTNSSNYRYIDRQENIDQLLNSVIAIVRADPSGGLRPGCSGFFIRPTIIVTASHCLAREEMGLNGFRTFVPGVLGDSAQFVTYQQWRNARTILPSSILRSTLIYTDTTNDFALLRTESFNSPVTLRMSSRGLMLGERVYAVSIPGGLPWFLSDGIISLLANNSSTVTERILATPSIFFGSSGCPLIDNFGNVIGVARAIANSQSNFGAYTPIHYVIESQERMNLN